MVSIPNWCKMLQNLYTAGGPIRFLSACHMQQPNWVTSQELARACTEISSSGIFFPLPAMASAESLEAVCTKAAKAMGYKDIKKEQLEVILSFIAGRDVFVSLPTGFGKSLCFSILPLVFDALGVKDSIVIVLTPLTAIMQDQVSLVHSLASY